MHIKTATTPHGRSVDVTLLVTFHREGILAHSTLNSLERCRLFAENVGISTEYIWVFDSIDEETRRVVTAHPTFGGPVTYVDVSHKDLGASRNSGIEIASGHAIAILDGDDYFSTNWIANAWITLQDYGKKCILHPELVINFGAHAAYGWHMDQRSNEFNINGLLTNNYWTSWNFSARDTYFECPYITTRPLETGFGYEDWHWNCETIAHGYVHRPVKNTVGFYRRKQVSLVTTTTSTGAIIPPSRLFSANTSKE